MSGDGVTGPLWGLLSGTSFLCCLWSIARVFVRAASGRQRFNVLGAWNAVTRQLLAVTNTTVVNTDTMCELLRKIAAAKLIKDRESACVVTNDICLSVYSSLPGPCARFYAAPELFAQRRPTWRVPARRDKADDSDAKPKASTALTPRQNRPPYPGAPGLAFGVATESSALSRRAGTHLPQEKIACDQRVPGDNSSRGNDERDWIPIAQPASVAGLAQQEPMLRAPRSKPLGTSEASRRGARSIGSFAFGSVAPCS
jgi:hypothetical protein